MSIGDNFNDLGMLEFAGTPVVMGNADPSLLERPEFYKTLSNDENGVARAIDRFHFANRRIKQLANKIAVIETNKGTIKFELLEDAAPKTTENFRIHAGKVITTVSSFTGSYLIS